MAFEKGNPGGPGRPKMPPELRAAWATLAAKGKEKLEAMLDDEDTPKQVVVKITELAMDRAWGKAVQAIDAEITERRPIVLDGAYGETPTETAGVDPAP